MITKVSILHETSKTGSNPILKNVVSWYGEITLKIQKKKPIKSIIEKPFRYSIMYRLGIRNLMNKKFISKGLLKTTSNSNLSKVHNYHLVKDSEKKISHLIL